VTEPLLVTERFYSIQGESTRAGLPCLFIRLAGCNLRCRYCDARYTYEEPGEPMAAAALVAWVEQFPGVLVELTGGEPLLQEGAIDLMGTLVATGRQVLLETNGSLSVAAVPEQVGIILDVKCPDSGMASHNLPANLDCLRERRLRGSTDEIKFVLSSEDDFLWARDLVARHGLDRKAMVLFSPVQPLLAPGRLAELLLAHRLNVRLQLQLHTLLWPDRSRGV
jgi:7-carboxy-7-deazaguanine synthase